MNIATFAGRLGRDAQTRQVSDTTATSFSLAVDDFVGGEKRTKWIDCTIWGDRGVRLESVLTKGKQVTVAGSVDVRQYESGGETKAVLTLRVDRITLQGGGQGQGQDEAPRDRRAAPQASTSTSTSTSTTARQAAAPADDIGEDDIPF